MATVLNINTTAASAKNPSTLAQTLHSYAIPEGVPNDVVLVISTIKVTTTGTSQAQTVTFRVTIGASTKDITYASRAAIDELQITLIHAAPAKAKGTVLTELRPAAAADAQTAVTSQSLIVIGLDKMQQGNA